MGTRKGKQLDYKAVLEKQFHMVEPPPKKGKPVQPPAPKMGGKKRPATHQLSDSDDDDEPIRHRQRNPQPSSSQGSPIAQRPRGGAVIQRGRGGSRGGRGGRTGFDGAMDEESDATWENSPTNMWSQSQ